MYPLWCDILPVRKMDGKNNDATIDDVIFNGHGEGMRGTAAVGMEASWEGHCGQEQLGVFSNAEAKGREPFAKKIVTLFQQCSCWHRLYPYPSSAELSCEAQ